ncbi:NUDIX hydrolase [Luteolibacter pohnpeiensis]|uniref:GDP-mannose pyrophosphatase n=1 Tax=Luteolibacter pohnpeiensis TaxID=454153 RepID=A0A934S4L6_9BACT|nr:NUDIX hydrolase [Luteolibacter pohnpeiensis]MBK1881130.1 NUDIX hydrolase [Luteolibacter pohnpeiensis]
MSKITTLFETEWLGLYRIGHWDFACRPHAPTAVGILAVTPESEIILIEQFRIPMQRRVIEVPAGIVGDEPEHIGEPLEETARRELLEETGYFASDMKLLLGTPTTAGMSSEIIYLFQASNLERRGPGGGTENEDITVHHVPLSELRAWLKQKESEGLLIDFKIHATLWMAGIIA